MTVGGGGTYLSACSRRKIVFLDRIYQSNSSCSRVGCRVLLGLCKTRPRGEQPGSRPAGAQGRVGAGRARPRRRVPEAEAAFLAPPLARRRPAGTCLGGRSPAAPAAPPGTTQRASANVRANERLALPAPWRLSRLCVSCASAGPGAASRGAARGARGRLCPFTPSFGRRVVSRKRRPGGRRAASRGAWGPASAAGRAAPCICGGQGWDGEAPSAAASAPGFLLPGSLESPLVGCHRRGGGRGHPHPPRGSLSQRANGSSLLRPPAPPHLPPPAPLARRPGRPHLSCRPPAWPALRTWGAVLRVRPTRGPASLASGSFLAAAIGEELRLCRLCPLPAASSCHAPRFWFTWWFPNPSIPEQTRGGGRVTEPASQRRWSGQLFQRQ